MTQYYTKEPSAKYKIAHLKYLKRYLWITPVLVFLDLVFSCNLRVPFLDLYPVLKFGFYAVSLAIGYSAFKFSQYFAALCIIESGLSVLCCLLLLIVPIMQYPLNGFSGEPPSITASIVNFVFVLVGALSNPYLARSRMA